MNGNDWKPSNGTEKSLEVPKVILSSVDEAPNILTASSKYIINFQFCMITNLLSSLSLLPPGHIPSGGVLVHCGRLMALCMFGRLKKTFLSIGCEQLKNLTIECNVSMWQRNPKRLGYPMLLVLLLIGILIQISRQPALIEVYSLLGASQRPWKTLARVLVNPVWGGRWLGWGI